MIIDKMSTINTIIQQTPIKKEIKQEKKEEKKVEKTNSDNKTNTHNYYT